VSVSKLKHRLPVLLFVMSLATSCGQTQKNPVAEPLERPEPNTTVLDSPTSAVTSSGATIHNSSTTADGTSDTTGNSRDYSWKLDPDSERVAKFLVENLPSLVMSGEGVDYRKDVDPIEFPNYSEVDPTADPTEVPRSQTMYAGCSATAVTIIKCQVSLFVYELGPVGIWNLSFCYENGSWLVISNEGQAPA
jgi:hypothetical protein